MKLILFIVLLLSATVIFSADNSIDRQSVYALESDNLTGSGVMVKHGLMITAAHVVLADPQVKVWFNNKLIKQKILKVNEEKDIALLAVDIPCPCAEIYTDPVMPDTEIYAVGFPFYNSLHMQFKTHGNIQGILPDGPFKGMILATISIYPGNSGGGLFTEKNGRQELVGIASRVLPETDISLFVSNNTIMEFIE